MNKYNLYFKLYIFFRDPLCIGIRVFGYLSLVGFFVIGSFFHFRFTFIFLLAIVYCLFIMNEIFILLHVNRLLPHLSLSETAEHPLESLMFYARALYVQEHSSYDIMKKLIHKKGVEFFL